MPDHLISEDSIAHYLQRNPEFFERHPDLLIDIRLTSPFSKRTISLLERQVEALRAKLRHIEQSLMQLVQNANDSGHIADAMFQWFEDVLRLHDLQRRRDYIESSLAKRFKIAAVHIALFHDEPPPSEAILEWLHTLRQPWCGAPQHQAQAPAAAQALHQALSLSHPHSTIGSIAVLPLIRADGSCMGLMVFGASDAQRFHAGIASELIARMALAVAAALEPEMAANTL